MPNLSALGDLLILYVFLGAAVLLVILAYRTTAVEREEGLARSKYRIPFAVAVCAVVGLLVLLSTLSAFRPPADPGRTVVSPPTVAPPTPPTTEPRSGSVAAPKAGDRAALDAQSLSRLEQQREQLRKDLKKIEEQIQTMTRDRPGAAPEPGKEREGEPERTDESVGRTDGSVGRTNSGIWPSFDIRYVALFLVPVLLLVGIVLLFLLTDPSILLRYLTLQGNRSERRAKALATLNAIAAAAEQGRYRDGLDLASGLDVNLLDRFDRLDWAYLKSYCAVQVAGPNDRALLETAVRDLTTLLEEAPDRGEAVYLLALTQGLLGQSRPSLGGFERAQRLLPSDLELPFAHNQSVCLLRLAEERLGSGDVAGSSPLFDRVNQLNVLVEQIPTALVKVRLLNVRRSLQANNLAEARAGLEVVRQLKGLEEAQRESVLVLCDALETLVCVREGDDAQIDKQLEAFLKAHLPLNLPEPDEAVADEYLDSPLEGIELRIDPQIHRAFFFLEADRAARRAARQGRPLTTDQVREIARPLQRGLQFEMRQRDLLAALGGLYYWFVPEKRRDAVRWLESAISLGVESRIARRLPGRDRRVEVENREALDWFRATSARFLHDPSVSLQVRQALAEEFGRFQGFQSLLLGLDLENEWEPQEATLSLVRERAAYLGKMVAEFAERKQGAIGADLNQMRSEYSELIDSFTKAMSRMADVERRLIQAIGKTVFS